MKKTEIIVTCDQAGAECEPGDVITMPFSLGGVGYEIDVCEPHRRQLLKRLAPLTEAGRVTGHVPSPKRPAKRDRKTPALVRAWAERAGVSVNPRGRISAEVLAQYDAAH